VLGACRFPGESQVTATVNRQTMDPFTTEWTPRRWDNWFQNFSHFFQKISGLEEQKGVSPTSSFFLDKCVTYWCLIVGPAAVEQYVDLQTSASETAWNSFKNGVLSQIWYSWTYTLLLSGPDVMPSLRK
jgi:hypothetical protein